MRKRDHCDVQERSRAQVRGVTSSCLGVVLEGVRREAAIGGPTARLC
jgi:hypothetical protein